LNWDAFDYEFGGVDSALVGEKDNRSFGWIYVDFPYIQPRLN